MRYWRLLKLTSTLAFCLIFIASQAFAAWTVTTVDVPGALSTAAYGISPGGKIVGPYAVALSTNSCSVSKSYHWSSGILTPVDVIGAVRVVAWGINTSGQIVGVITNVSGSQGFIREGSLIRVVDVPPNRGTDTQLHGINTQSKMVGTYKDLSTQENRGFILVNGIFRWLDVPGAKSTMANAINNLDEVVGQFTDAAGKIHGFLWKSGTFTPIDVPGASQTSARGINGKSQVVGTFRNASGTPYGFILDKGKFTTLVLPNAVGTYLFGINDSGQMVGQYESPDGINHGFIAR